MKVPGLVDLQVNGHMGVDFSSLTVSPEEMARACRGVLAVGTSGFLATLITSTPEVYKRNLEMLAVLVDSEELRGQLLGIHLEGPFLSPQPGARGAHNPDWMRKCDVDSLAEMVERARGTVKMVTIAAEVDGAEELILWAVEHGITVSLGHQMAGEKELARAAAAGAKSLTHLGNGVPSEVDRHNNPMWAGMANDDLSAMIITDGHHLPSTLIKSLIRAKGVARTVVVSDASSLAGLGPGQYNSMGDDAVISESGRLYNPNTGYLVGSAMTMIECMNYLGGIGILTAEELLQVGFYNPLELIGLEANDVRVVNEMHYDEAARVFEIVQ